MAKDPSERPTSTRPFTCLQFKKKVNEDKILRNIISLCETSLQLSYTMPSTASFSLIECRHFFHWATDEWTYTLEPDIVLFYIILQTEILCKTPKISNSLSILGPQPYSRQNTAHFLGFFSHQIRILCTEVWTHSILQQVTFPVYQSVNSK